MSVRSVLKKALPKPILHALKTLLGRPTGAPRWKRGQQDPEYYDHAFDKDPSWRLHYTYSPYYIIWTVIIDRLRQGSPDRVLEIGCGSGQLASAIRDAGLVKQYVGFDFSTKRLEQARIACPEFHFEIADAFRTDLIERAEYDTVITTEFLEHVEGDLDIIRRIRTGTRTLATVPNFPYTSHVRHFKSSAEVMERYGDYFDDFYVATILANDKGKTFFLMDGQRNSYKK